MKKRRVLWWTKCRRPRRRPPTGKEVSEVSIFLSERIIPCLEGGIVVIRMEGKKVDVEKM